MTRNKKRKYLVLDNVTMDIIDPCNYKRDDYVTWIVEVYGGHLIHKGVNGHWFKGNIIRHVYLNERQHNELRAYMKLSNNDYTALDAVCDLENIFT